MHVFKTRVGILALVVLTLVVLAGAGTPQSASAMGVNIDPSSCGGVGHPNCTSLPANVTIGANSCTVASSCDGLQNGIVIGSGSCNGDDACYLSGGSIGDDSCNDLDACYQGGFDGNSSIGDHSCDDVQACLENGSDGNGSIGDNSCNGNSACLGNGSYSGSGSVGDGSCNAANACRFNGEAYSGSVGDDSCNAASACFDLGQGGTGSVGNYSCNGASACYEGKGSVGNLSCNQTGQYDANCQNTHEDVGNCTYNDETPVLCTQATIQVEKVVVGNSSDRFDLKIDGVVQAYHVGNGGTTDPVAVDPGSYFVGESAVYPARLSDYDQRTTCDAYNAIAGTPSVTIVPRTRGVATFNVSAGDVVTCTMTNTKVSGGFFPFRR